MNKYELALVVSAKVEDEVRNATVEKAKEYITSLGGTITNVDEWGKKKLDTLSDSRHFIFNKHLYTCHRLTENSC